MEYNKTLAVTGSLGGIALLTQLRSVLIIMLAVSTAALLIRLFWRKNKNINE